MRDRLDRIVPRVTAEHPHRWLWEPLETDRGFVLRTMFGAKAVYLDGRLMLCFCTGEEPWDGVLVCTDRERQAALAAEFPLLVPHPVLPKWLYLAAEHAAFDRLAARLVSLARQRDPRLGVDPSSKKKRNANRKISARPLKRRRNGP